MKNSTSNESCTNCAASGGTTPRAEQNNPPMTYNEGAGVKDQIVLTGPLSAQMAAAMNWIFEKKPLELTPNPPQMDTSEEKQALAATETIAIDTHLEAMVAGMGKAPELSVVLSDFDVRSVKDHVQDVAEGKFDAVPGDVTTVYVTDAQDIIKPNTYEPMVEGGFRGIAVVVGDMGGVGPLGAPEEDFTTVDTLAEDAPEHFKLAVEKLFEGTGVKVCFGFEAFAQELAARKKKA